MNYSRRMFTTSLLLRFYDDKGTAAQIAFRKRSLTGETKHKKNKMFDTEELTSDIENQTNEAVDGDVLFGYIILFL